ncbi:hypothetical protein X73_00177 [Pasteurella multocida subsp. gallicida X73]|nr:hypothetical protein NT08PM_1159 [Pasteurella multocida subsp. multocida str. 3480]EJZ80012.1 hypothetical protein X73_00177 [Pasteurella multocida subsp. gallicida X73]
MSMSKDWLSETTLIGCFVSLFKAKAGNAVANNVVKMTMLFIDFIVCIYLLF